MLKFIFGRAASGKTFTVFSKIKEQVEHGNRDVVLLVPEQFTFECEKEMLHILGDRNSTAVPVLSFSRLSDEVARNSGGISSNRLDSTGRLVFMSRALCAVRDELCFFGKYAKNRTFAKSLVSAIDEFKNNGIDSNALRAVSKTLGECSLSKKLYDTALVMDTYDALISDRFSDPSDDMARLFLQLSDYAYFAGRTVFVDSFKNFGGAQLKILDQIMRQADDVVISMCYDPDTDVDSSVFSNVGDTVQAVRSIANKYGIREEKPDILESSHYSAAEICALEKMLAFKSDAVYPDDAPSISVYRAGSVYDEAEFTAAQIRRLVRTGEYRYRDFVVICRNADRYSEAIRHMFLRYEIPCYTGKKENILSLPFTVFVLSAMNAAVTMSSENILEFLKTGLSGLNSDEISELENYVFVWKIDGKKWMQPWDMSPSGFEKPASDDVERLERINGYRQRTMSSLCPFSEKFDGSAKQMASAVWKLIEDCGVRDKLAADSELLDPQGADLARQGYDALINILDSLVNTLGDSFCTKNDFIEYFSLSVSDCEIGAIPQMLDEVTFGAADCIRPSRPKIVFVLGLNNGVFPSICQPSGMLGSGERKKLIESGLPIKDFSAGYSIDEDFLVYSSVCCAADRVYLSYCNFDSAMTQQMPSLVIEKVLTQFPNCEKVFSGDKEINIQNIETPASAFTLLMRNKNDPSAPSLKTVLADIEPYKSRLLVSDDMQNNAQQSLDPKTSTGLFGENINLSASGIDTYFRCNFMYFCRYGLRARVIKPAEIDVLQRGTMVHAVLEKMVTCDRIKLSKLTDGEIDEGVTAAINEYLSAINGIESVEDNRLSFIVSQIESLCGDVVRHIRDEFISSSFEPMYCEMKIGGEDADIEETVIPLEHGTARLRGAVDRLDGCGAYIRVVDYKTGTRKFALPDVLFGLNMQMLIYLYAVMKNERFSDKIPTGVLYLETGRKVGEDKNFVMNGIISEDEKVVRAMDRDNSGNFVPELRKKKDGSFYTSKSFIQQETFDGIFRNIDRLLQHMGNCLHNGKISVNPVDSKNSNACKYCEFSSVCGIENRVHGAVTNISHKDAEKVLIEGGEQLV